MKKVTKIFCFAVAAFIVTLSFAGCDGTDKKSAGGVGYVSEAIYESADDAVQAYVENEFSVDKVSYWLEEKHMLASSLLSKKSKGEVAVAKLNLTQEQRADVVAAERFALQVNVDFYRDNSYGSEEETENTATVWDMDMVVLCYESGRYAYAVPKAKTGERATYGEVQRAYGYESHENCTVTSWSEEYDFKKSAWVFEDGEVYEWNDAEVLCVKYKDKKRFDKRSPVYEDVLPEDEADLAVYYKLYRGKTIYTATASDGAAYRDGDKVTEQRKGGLDLIRVQAICGFGTGGLTKTSKGYSIALKNVESLQGADVSVEITVKDGRAVKTHLEASTAKMRMRMTAEYTNFGETTAHLPDMLQEYVEKAERGMNAKKADETDR